VGTFTHLQIFSVIDRSGFNNPTYSVIITKPNATTNTSDSLDKT